MIALAKLQPIYNACNPDESLSPDDKRNVDFDTLYRREEAVRGAQWARHMARQIELSGPVPVCKLFTGLRGSGKSTELRRLTAMLAAETGPHLFPVLIDAEEMLDLSSAVDVPDVLATIVFGTERALLQAEGRNPDDAMKDSSGRRFINWITRTDIELKEANLGAGDLGQLVLEMKTQETLRQRVRRVVGAHMSAFLREVRQELVLLNQRAKDLGFAGLVLIYDSLEKLQGISSTWADVLRSAEQMFAGGAPYLQLPVHVLYTIPPAVALRLHVEVHYLPMIKLHDREGVRFAPGYAAAREMILHRVPEPVLNEVLGPTQREARLERLIEWSGGYPREIVRLLQALLEVEDDLTTDREFERVLTRAGDAYRRVVLASGAFELLTRVVREKDLRLETEADHEAVDRLLAASVVLRYLNDSNWFELHPAVYEIPQLKQARAEALAAKGTRAP